MKHRQMFDDDHEWVFVYRIAMLATYINNQLGACAHFHNDDFEQITNDESFVMHKSEKKKKNCSLSSGAEKGMR